MRGIYLTWVPGLEVEDYIRDTSLVCRRSSGFQGKGECVYANRDAGGPLAVSWFGLGVASEGDKLVDIEAYGAWALDRLI
jgi:hypothetical protein